MLPLAAVVLQCDGTLGSWHTVAAHGDGGKKTGFISSGVMLWNDYCKLSTSFRWRTTPACSLPPTRL
uniref:Putative secreted protein n=1 Tax=Anopheles darlingi TaxID=43151 RepID=A0A2M4DDT9_ANODA